jgi:hypothetical protein
LQNHTSIFLGFYEIGQILKPVEDLPRAGIGGHHFHRSPRLTRGDEQ